METEFTQYEIDIVKQWLDDWEIDINDKNIDIEILSKQLFSDENNYNNNDVTSQQTVFSQGYIFELLNFIWKYYHCMIT
jgi:hypothetical protein